MNVKVYYNLRKKCLSVVACEGINKGRVIFYAQTIYLQNVRFKVSETGRQRVLAEKQKNVHAYMYGKITNVLWEPLSREITYNPYKYSSFVDKSSLKPVDNAKFAIVHGQTIVASD